MDDGFSLKRSTVGILGLGLMGGSLAMGLKGKCSRLIGFDAHLATLELALSKNIVDQAESDFPPPQSLSPREREVDLLILAVPVPSILDTLQRLPSLIQHTCIIMDIGSTKRDIVHAMSALPDHLDPIGGHPICGKEKLGFEYADVNLYQDAPFVITPMKRTSTRARSAAAQIISAVGANYIEMTAEEHDRILASTSHLPFLLSSALSYSTPREFASLAGPGFRSTIRLAGTPSHMMMGILKSNRDHVLNALHEIQTQLTEIESALAAEEYKKLESFLDQSQNKYHAFV